MNFAQVGHSIVSHPITSVAIAAGVGIVARVAIKAGIQKHKTNAAERAKVDAILARRKPIKRVQLAEPPV